MDGGGQGLPVAVGNAVPEIRSVCSLKLTRNGGFGAVREFAELLLKANAEGMKVANVRFVSSSLFFRKQERNYANSEGSVINQVVLQSWPLMQITAVAPDFSDFQNRTNVAAPAAHAIPARKEPCRAPSALRTAPDGDRPRTGEHDLSGDTPANPLQMRPEGCFLTRDRPEFHVARFRRQNGEAVLHRHQGTCA